MDEETTPDDFRTELIHQLQGMEIQWTSMISEIKATSAETPQDSSLKHNLQRLIHHGLVEVGVELGRLKQPSPYVTVDRMRRAKDALDDRLVEIGEMLERLTPNPPSAEDPGAVPANDTNASDMSTTPTSPNQERILGLPTRNTGLQNSGSKDFGNMGPPVPAPRKIPPARHARVEELSPKSLPEARSDEATIPTL